MTSASSTVRPVICSIIGVPEAFLRLLFFITVTLILYQIHHGYSLWRHRVLCHRIIDPKFCNGEESPFPSLRYSVTSCHLLVPGTAEYKFVLSHSRSSESSCISSYTLSLYRPQALNLPTKASFLAHTTKSHTWPWTTMAEMNVTKKWGTNQNVSLTVSDLRDQLLGMIVCHTALL